MTSKERHEKRYQRRKAKREQKKNQGVFHKNFEEIFTYDNIYRAFLKCKRGVMWKSSVQSYRTNLPINTYELFTQLKNGSYRSKGFEEFTINERGKVRYIKSVHISERCIQRCLCDQYLVPLLSKNLIYDNGATIENKGTDFTLRRLKVHLQKHFRKYGNEGYIATLDFSDYFNSINHKNLYEILDKKIYDNFGRNGLGLGSQISQICAVSFPNSIDHMIKDELQIKGYGRYMDDSYIISYDLNIIKDCISRIQKKCKELGIILKSSKIKIFRLSNMFSFLKKRILLTQTGKVVMKVSRISMRTERRKLKKLKNLFIKGKITYSNVYQSYVSWRSHSLKYNSYRSVKKMDKLYRYLFC